MQTFERWSPLRDECKPGVFGDEINNSRLPKVPLEVEMGFLLGVGLCAKLFVLFISSLRSIIQV